MTHLVGVVMLGRGTEYLDTFPMRDKTAESCGEAYLEFVVHIFELYTDGAAEQIKAAKDAKLSHSTSTHGRLGRNGVAERAVRSVEQGSRTIMLLSCLIERFMALRHPP